jgi:hypothetical protein
LAHERKKQNLRKNRKKTKRNGKNSSTTISWCMQNCLQLSKAYSNRERLRFLFCAFFTPRLTCNLVVLNFEEEREEILVVWIMQEKGSFRFRLKRARASSDFRCWLLTSSDRKSCNLLSPPHCHWLTVPLLSLWCCWFTCQLPSKLLSTKSFFFQVFQIESNSFKNVVRLSNAKISASKKKKRLKFGVP